MMHLKHDTVRRIVRSPIKYEDNMKPKPKLAA